MKMLNFIFSLSMGDNEDQQEFPTPENVPLFLGDLNEKRSSYFISKIYGEALFHHSNLPFIILT